MNNELETLLHKAYDDGIITSIILTKILKAKEDLKLSDPEFHKLDDQIRITTYLKKVNERKEQGIMYVGDLTKQYKITEEEKELLKELQIAKQKPAPETKPAPEAKPAAPPVTTSAAKKPNGNVALIVDDNVNHLTLTKKVLEKGGYICHTAESPDSACKIAVQVNPSIVLCDFNFGIGKQTGLDLFHEMKAKKMNVPFIIVSAYFQKEFVDYAFGIGVTDYLTKPFEPEELLKTVKKHLAAKKQ